MNRRTRTLLPLFLLSLCAATSAFGQAYEFDDYGKTVTVSKTIVVQAGQTFDGRLPDGRLTRYIANRTKLGDGSQKEGQKPIFIVKPGAKLQNIIIDKPAADGIHVEAGTNKQTRIRNVQFRDIGEDAITISSGNLESYVVIDSCLFQNASDKVIQVNAPSRVHIVNCVARNFARFARATGTGANSSYRISIDRLVAYRGETILKMTNPKSRGEVRNSYFTQVTRIAEADNGAQIEVSNSKIRDRDDFEDDVKDMERKKPVIIAQRPNRDNDDDDKKKDDDDNDERDEDKDRKKTADEDDLEAFIKKIGRTLKDL